MTMALPDFMDDVNDLLLYVLDIDQDHLIRGNQSREVLPDDDNFCIFTPLRQKRIGTNITELDAVGVAVNKNAPCNDKKLVQIDIQIDVYGDEAYDKACGLETFCGSFQCNDWLIRNNMGIRVLYASDPVDLTYVDETEQYVQRWMVTMSICTTSEFTSKIPWLEDVTIKAIKNVDVYFKP